MDRPEKIYLDEPIKLFDIEVRHTKTGLQYLVDHYNKMLEVNTPQQLSDEGRKHYIKMIEQYQQHIELYNKQV